MQAITRICLSSAAAKLPPTSPTARKRCRASPVLHRNICVRRTASNPGVQVIADRVCENAAPGAIVLLHDGDSPKNLAPRDQTIEAVGLIIDRLRAEGYEFVTIEELNK